MGTPVMKQCCLLLVLGCSLVASRRGARFLSTSGSFTLSGANRAGNDEEELGELDHAEDLGEDNGLMEPTPVKGTVKTTPHGKYVRAFVQSDFAKRPFALRLELSTSDNAFIFLSSGGAPAHGNGVEILLGGWSNTRNVARKGPEGTELATNSQPAFAHGSQVFHLRWDRKELSVYKGCELSACEAILSLSPKTWEQVGQMKTTEIWVKSFHDVHWAWDYYHTSELYSDGSHLIAQRVTASAHHQSVEVKRRNLLLDTYTKLPCVSGTCSYSDFNVKFSSPEKVAGGWSKFMITGGMKVKGSPGTGSCSMEGRINARAFHKYQGCNDRSCAGSIGPPYGLFSMRLGSTLYTGSVQCRLWFSQVDTFWRGLAALQRSVWQSDRILTCSPCPK